MSMPGGVDNVTIPDGMPELLFPMSPPTVPTRSISSGYALTRDNVEEQLKNDKIRNNPRIRGPKSDVDSWTGDIASAFSNAAQATWELMVVLPIIGDFIEVITGKPDGNPHDLGSVINNIKQGIQDGWNLLVNSLFGWSVWDASSGDAEQALADQAATVSAMASIVTELSNSRNNAAAGGVAAFIDFTTRDVATSLGSDFDQLYSGLGTGLLGIGNGAEWLAVNDAPRACTFRYNLLETVSDYQRVFMAFGSTPEPGIANPARNEIHARKNAAGDTLVYASMEKSKAQLGCVVAGVTTVFVTKTSGFSFKPNSIYSLECGTVGGLRVYRLLEGNRPVLVHTEVGTTSQVGPDYRGSGGLVYAFANGVGTNRPARIAAFAVSDNLPPTVVGSFCKIYRANTGSVAMYVGTHLLQNGFWDNPGANTADFTINYTTGEITVSMDGNYRCAIQAMTGTNFPEQFTWVLHVNGDPVEWAGDSHMRGQSEVGGVIYPDVCSGAVVVPLQAGDTVSWGYKCDDNLSPVSNVLRGEPSSYQTYFTVALTNRSLA